MYTFCTARINYYTRCLYYKKQNCHKSCRRAFNFFYIDLFRTKNPMMVVFIIEHREERRFFIYTHYIMYTLSTYIVRILHRSDGTRAQEIIFIVIIIVRVIILILFISSGDSVIQAKKVRVRRYNIIYTTTAVRGFAKQKSIKISIGKTTKTLNATHSEIYNEKQ